MKKNKKANSVPTVFGVIAVLLVIAILMFGLPTYNVWQKGLQGKAQLAEADYNRQIAVREAQAELESAELKSQADVIRAAGIAEANKIIAGSISEEYLKYKFIEGLNDGHTEVIYVPTEANLPILEARG